MYKRIIINIGLRCIGASIGCFGAMTILPNLMINDSGRCALQSLICLSGSACMISCGTLAFCIKPEFALMMHLAGTGILLQTIGLLLPSR